jgi:plastocyanin
MPGRILTQAAWSYLALHLLAFQPMIAQQKESASLTPSRSFGKIHGKITVSVKGEAHDEHLRDALSGRYAIHSEKNATVLTNPAGTGQSRLSERAAVYLENDGLNQGKYPIPEKRPVLDQKNLQFHPLVLPILVGTTVDFPNRDNLFHNVFSYSQAGEFDLGRYPKDDSRAVTFDRPGIVRVYCDIHSHMSATILVLQNPFFATPGEDGGYAISHVPEGKYWLVFWYDRDVVERRSIDVHAGESVEVNFTY